MEVKQIPLTRSLLVPLPPLPPLLPLPRPLIPTLPPVPPHPSGVDTFKMPGKNQCRSILYLLPLFILLLKFDVDTSDGRVDDTSVS